MSDFLIEQNEIDEECITLYRTIMSLSLFHLKMYHRALRFIDKYQNLLDFEPVRIIFLKLNSLVEPQSPNLAILKSRKSLEIEIPKMKIEKESIETHLEGIIKTANCKKEALVRAFQLDNRNFESLIVLKRESLITEDELKNIIDSSKQELSRTYHMVLFYQKSALNSPFFAENVALKLYNQKNVQGLIFMGMAFLDRYPEESTSLFIYGLANIIQNKFSDAKIIFYEAIKLERTFGPLWIFLGVAYSNLREHDSAKSAFEYAKQLMIGSYKPDFYLALEYHKLSNMNQANAFYLNALRLKRDPHVIIKYCALLIHFEYYSEALKLLQSLKIYEEFKNAHLLLLSYAFLFTGEIEKAKILIEEATKDWRYYATKGYLAHLQSKVDEASEFYTNAIIEKGRSWIIEDLLKNAIELKDNKKDNMVYDYGTSLFEFLDLKSADTALTDIWK